MPFLIVMHNADDLFRTVLRTSREPFGYFDEELVHSLLTDRPSEYYHFILGELTDIASGQSHINVPPKQVFSDPEGGSDFRVMPCVIRGKSGVRKTVKLIGTNTKQHTIPHQVTVGKAFAVHPEENFVSHIFEACLLSSARTGICAAIAISLLSSSRKRITICGTGRVGYYTALYAVSLGKVKDIYLTDIENTRAEQAMASLKQQAPHVNFEVRSVNDSGDTDVLVLATTSTSPICSPPGYGANLVISLGADTDSQSELEQEWAKIADIFADTNDSIRFGDLRTWVKSRLISPEQVTGLLDIIGKELPDAQRQRIFISTGSALFDNLTIGYLLSRSHGKKGYCMSEPDQTGTSEMKSSNL